MNRITKTTHRIFLKRLSQEIYSVTRCSNYDSVFQSYVNNYDQKTQISCVSNQSYAHQKTVCLKNVQRSFITRINVTDSATWCAFDGLACFHASIHMCFCSQHSLVLSVSYIWGACLLKCSCNWCGHMHNVRCTCHADFRAFVLAYLLCMRAYMLMDVCSWCL